MTRPVNDQGNKPNSAGYLRAAKGSGGRRLRGPAEHESRSFDVMAGLPLRLIQQPSKAPKAASLIAISCARRLSPLQRCGISEDFHRPAGVPSGI
jgi:hypothetical protein